jgi:hypothetical protein
MVLERPQRADDVFDFILLKQTDSGDAGGSHLEAGSGIVEIDATEREDRDIALASFPQCGEARGFSPGTISFLEHRSEDGEVSTLRLGTKDLCLSVAGDSDGRAASRGLRAASERLRPDVSRFEGGNVVGTQVDTVQARGEPHIGSGVDQKTSSQFPVLSSQLLNDMRGFMGKLLQIACGQVFFAELDVVHSRARSLSDLGKQNAAAGAFIAWKLRAVGDVVEQTAVSHRLSAYYECGADIFVRGLVSCLGTVSRTEPALSEVEGNVRATHATAGSSRSPA